MKVNPVKEIKIAFMKSMYVNWLMWQLELMVEDGLEITNKTTVAVVNKIYLNAMLCWLNRGKS